MNQIIEIPLAELFPHPDNPRKDLGDLTELAASIKESGLLQNLTVIDGRYLDEQEWAEMEAADERMAALTGGTYEPLEYDPHNPIADGYTVIIGHRRCEAARLAGLETVPCAVVEMDYKTQLATMMAENVQRADLTPFEQANGFQLMLDLGMSIGDVVKKTGFTEGVVRRRLKLAGVDTATFGGNNYTLFDLERIAKIKDKKKRDDLYRKVGTDDFGSSIRYAERDQTEKDAENKIKKLIKAAKPGIEFCDPYQISTTSYYRYRLCETIKGKLDEPIDLTSIPEEAIAAGIRLSYDLTNVTICFGKEQPEEKEPELTEQQKKNAAIKETRLEKLKKMTALHRDLREDFIKNVAGTKILANLPIIMRGLGISKNKYRDYKADEVVKRILDLKNAKTSYLYGNELAEITAEAYEKDPARGLLVHVYSMLAPDRWIEFYSENGGGKYEKNDNLKLAYEILTALGYKMSTEEIKLSNGTSELYKKATYAALYDEQKNA